MKIEEQFTTILEKSRDKEIMAFLKSCTADERKSLAPVVKKLGKYYFESELSGNTWRSRGNDKQHHILNQAFFACYNRKDFERAVSPWLMNRKFLEQFLSWYCPPWFNEYINGLIAQDWLPAELTYDYLVELSDRGFIQPSPELLARQLVPYIFEHNKNQHAFVPAKLKNHTITIDEHIWYVFQFETNIHFAGRYLTNEGKPLASGWLHAFLYLTGEGLVDRSRLLKEALLAANRNFNKNLSGWWADVFEALQPSRENLLELQPEIYNLFSSPHSKVVNTGLQACKDIIDDVGFQVQNFLDHIPVILSSETKSVVTSALRLLEKLVKNQGDKSAICLLVTGALVHKDEGLQARAAKIIQKWGKPEDEELKQTLQLYIPLLFSGVKDVLSDYINTEDAIETEKISVHQPQSLSLNNETLLPVIHDVDELVFLAAQAFDNNESWHIDLLPAALLQLHKQIKPEEVEKFEPAVQRALKLFFGDFRSTQGALDQLLASFFLDYALLLVKQFPQQAGSISNLFKTFMYKTERNKKIWDENAASTSFLVGWKIPGDIYKAHKKLLEAVLYTISQGSDLPLICAPTHAPAWIDPLILVQRIHKHQELNERADETDLQVALSRCWLQQPDAALEAAKKLLTGEIQRIMIFLLDPQQSPEGPFTMEASWMTAALAKSPSTIYPQLSEMEYSHKPRALYSGQFPWKTFVEDYMTDKYDWRNGKMHIEKVAAKRKVLKIDFSVANNTEPKPSGLKKFLSKITRSVKAPETGPEPLLYNNLIIKNNYIISEEKDIRRVYMLTPNNPEPVMALAVDKSFDNPVFFGETQKRLAIEVLKAYLESPKPLGEMGHLFIANSLLCSDKTAAAYAAEIWIQGVQQKNINSQLLGNIIGTMERIEFAPLKRSPTWP